MNFHKNKEGWPRGLRHSPAKGEWGKTRRGFESHTLRHPWKSVIEYPWFARSNYYGVKPEEHPYFKEEK